MLVRPGLEHDTDTIAEVFLASFRGLAFLPLVHSDDGSGNEEREPDALYEWTPTPL